MLRDRLAKNRTILANERTLLAYVRTAIMLAVSGVTVLRILRGEQFYLFVGAGLILLAVFVGLYGAFRFQKLARRLKNCNSEEEDSRDSNAT